NVDLRMSGLAAAGVEFETLRATASGNSASHRAEVTTTGQPLAFAVAVEGGRKENGWAGAVQRLVLEVKDAAKLTLRDPANVVVKTQNDAMGVDVSRACFVDRDIELCLQGALQPDGSMEGSYSLANVPLALANSMSTEDLPLRFNGMIEGQGDIRRDADG